MCLIELLKLSDSQVCLAFTYDQRMTSHKKPVITTPINVKERLPSLIVFKSKCTKLPYTSILIVSCRILSVWKWTAVWWQIWSNEFWNLIYTMTITTECVPITLSLKARGTTDLTGKLLMKVFWLETFESPNEFSWFYLSTVIAFTHTHVSCLASPNQVHTCSSWLYISSTSAPSNQLNL